MYFYSALQSLLAYMHVFMAKDPVQTATRKNTYRSLQQQRIGLELASILLVLQTQGSGTQCCPTAHNNQALAGVMRTSVVFDLTGKPASSSYA